MTSSKNRNATGREFGIKRRQSRKQHIEIVAGGHQVGLTEEDEGGAIRLLISQNCTEIGIRRHHNAVFVDCSRDDFLVFRRLHPIRAEMNGIVAFCQQQVC